MTSPAASKISPLTRTPAAIIKGKPSLEAPVTSAASALYRTPRASKNGMLYVVSSSWMLRAVTKSSIVAWNAPLSAIRTSTL